MRKALAIIAGAVVLSGAADADDAKKETTMAGNVAEVTGLTVDHLESPLGLGSPRPRLGWRLATDRRGAAQTAYQVVAESADNGKVLWDSGRVASPQSVDVAWGGRALGSGASVSWKVRVWDATGAGSAWSQPARFETGLLEEADWSESRWIAATGCDYRGSLGGLIGPGPAPMLRKSFRLPCGVRKARVYVSALGYGDVWVNGRRIVDPVLAPAPAQYDRRAYYVTYDLTGDLREGENAFGVILGTGWYNAYTQGAWQFENAPWRDRTKLIARLDVELADGRRQTFVSDLSWKCNTGPIRFDGLRNGEFYDARQEIQRWAEPGFDDSGWRGVVIIPGPGGVLSAQTSSIRLGELMPAREVREVKPGVFVADMGQNVAGWTRLQNVTGPAGTEITLVHSELCGDDGDINQKNIASFVKDGGCQTDKYTLKGGAPESWEPRFTYHGFRYVQITGFPGRPTPDQIVARVVNTELPDAGSFSCSNEVLNRIQRNTLWSYRGNFVGIPTDCPHREQNGWTGDAQLATETGLFNFLAAPAYRQWLEIIADAMRPNGQLPGIVPSGGWGYNWGSGPAWDAVMTHIPWYLYLYTGDTDVLARYYAKMTRYMDFMDSMSDHDLLHFGLGDWCNPDDATGPNKAPTSLTSTGYYYANARILEQTATVLGKPEDAARFRQQAERIRVAFNRAFYDPVTGLYKGNCMTSNGCALYQGMVDPAETQKAVAALVSLAERDGYTAKFGILGAKYALNALTAYGRADVAYRIATQTAYPSWGQWLERGATTRWEDWRARSAPNHIMFGDIGAWMYKTLAGIDPDAAAPGFRHFTVRPWPQPGLEWVKARHATPYGLIRVEWRQASGKPFELDLDVPPNTTATAALPVSADPATVTESGQPATSAPGLTALAREPGRAVYRAAAGKYRFSVGP